MRWVWVLLVFHSVNGQPVYVVKEQVVAALINPGCDGTQIFTLNNSLCVRETLQEVGEQLK
jgi:hypothetical protein